MLLPLHILPGGLLSDDDIAIVCVQAVTIVVDSPYTAAVNAVEDPSATTIVIDDPRTVTTQVKC